MRSGERKILDAIAASGRDGMTVADLIDVLYGARRDGGPLCAVKVVHVLICRINKMLGALDPPSCILTQRGRRSARYMLATVPATGEQHADHQCDVGQRRNGSTNYAL